MLYSIKRFLNVKGGDSVDTCLFNSVFLEADGVTLSFLSKELLVVRDNVLFLIKLGQFAVYNVLAKIVNNRI